MVLAEDWSISFQNAGTSAIQQKENKNEILPEEASPHYGPHMYSSAKKDY